MNRRDTLKALGLTAVSGGILLDACKPGEKKAAAETTTGDTPGKELPPGREAFELERNAQLQKERFFTDHEMATITILADIIIPTDEVSGSASDAGVPEFIEFIVKDIPSHKTPMRGGLHWLDVQCMKRYQNAFKDCSSQQQVAMVTDIAYPEKIQPGMEQGVAFFNRMRDLTASGFFTTEMGVNDLGYIGNATNIWQGVPEDILKQYGMEGV